MNRLRVLAACVVLGVVGQAQATTPTDAINHAADELRDRLVSQRRDIHMHPELAYREVRTAGIVADRLRALGFDDVRTGVARTGVVGVLKGGKPGPVVAMRADMDALPINETMDVPYRSQTPGVKHACGHDAHTTIGLGVAEVLSKMRADLPGTVKFIFQPAEEGSIPTLGDGAKLMIKEGALENPRPAAIFALHCTTEIDAGKIGIRAGGAQASADHFEITIHGKGAHPAHPELGVDSVVVAAECVTALQTIRSRRTDPLERVLLTIGTIHGGKIAEEIASDVKLEGALRSFSEAARATMKQEIRRTVEGVCAAYGGTADVKITEQTMVVYNDPTLVEETLPAMRHAIGETNVIDAEYRMGSEDFSYFQQVVPGFLFRLGSGNKARGIVANQHTPEYDVDEECLVVGTKVMSNVLWDFLDRHASTAGAR